jgi:hypothetical protein
MEKTAAQNASSAVLAGVGTAVLPGIGTALGAAAGNIVGKLFGAGGQGKTWDKKPQDVSQWATKYAPEAFIQWMKTNHPTSFGDLDAIKALQYTWADGGGPNAAFLFTNDPNFWIGGSKAKTNEFFTSLGIDLPASQAHNLARGGDGNRISATLDAIPSAGGPSKAVVDELQNIKDKAAAGKPLTPAEKAAMKDIGGKDLGSSIVPLLLLALVVYLIAR